jgi:sec-independent protein translocase protein TatB
MFDVGLGEIAILAVIGLFVFGPERLPKAAADAGKWVRQLRTMAANAKTELADSAGVDLTETLDTVKSFGDLHPRRLAKDFLDVDDDPATPQAAARPSPTIDPDAT